MKTKQNKKGTITVTAGNSTREQAKMFQMLNAFCGGERLQECEKCGGIAVDAGPAAGRCCCEETKKNN